MMRRQSVIMLALVIVATALSINVQANPVTCTVTYSDGLSCGVCNVPLIPTMTQSATLTTVDCICAQTGGTCYRVVDSTPYAFSEACSIVLPQVGQVFQGGLFDQTFHDTTKTHEDWHYNYAVALAQATYGRLEAWSASYYGGCYHTVADALAAGYADMEAAWANAQLAWSADFNTDVNVYEQNPGSYCHIVDVGGVDTWRSVNPDWGADAVAYANTINPTFTTSPGTCPCIPEPASCVTLLGCVVSLVGCVRLRHRRAA